MRIAAGIWMDHRKAVTVILRGHDTDTCIIESDAESPTKTSGGHHQVTPFAHQDVVPEDYRKRKYTFERDQYFQRILQRINTANELVLIGPGEAKKEFINYLIKHRSPVRLKECKAVGSMTDKEVVQHTCEAFNLVYH